MSVLFHRRRLQDPDAPAQLKYCASLAQHRTRACQRTPAPADIQRSFVAFLVATALFLVWVVSFQMTWRHWGRSLLVVDTDSDW